jgi:hypothetical protein
MKGKLHTSDDIEFVMTDMLVRLRTQLRGIPHRIAPALLRQTDLNVIKDIALTAIDECLTELSNYSPELFTNPDYFISSEYTDEDSENQD